MTYPGEIVPPAIRPAGGARPAGRPSTRLPGPVVLPLRGGMPQVQPVSMERAQQLFKGGQFPPAFQPRAQRARTNREISKGFVRTNTPRKGRT